MTQLVCTVAAAPLRQEPSHRSEMTSQLLFGEAMELLETSREWVRVRCLHDWYEGWIILDQTAKMETGEAATGKLAVVTDPIVLQAAVHHYLPMGALLRSFDPAGGQPLLENEVPYQGNFRMKDEKGDLDFLRQLMGAWIHAPYLWGGRTLLGVDCSGFVQVVFRAMGLWLPRDAWQQEGLEGRLIRIGETRTGDLAFFHNEEGRIVHVGIVNDGGSIIHASGRVRIDGLDAEGIVRSDGQRTHRLHSIKRILDL